MKNVLITGASRGLGLAILRSQLDAGNRVIAVSRWASSELQELIDNRPDQLQFIPFDLAEPESIKRQLIVEQIGLEMPIHSLVNNAAMAYDDIVTNLDQDSLETMFRVNVYSAMQLTRHAIRSMLLHQIAGSIVHISSISAHTGYKGLAMYAASKGAIEAFSKNVAREWGVKGIRSNCVVAGFMETEMTGELTEEQKERIYQRTALKQPANTTCVAAMVSFLLSEESKSITGQNLFVDSGTI